MLLFIGRSGYSFNDGFLIAGMIALRILSIRSCVFLWVSIMIRSLKEPDLETSS